MFRFAKSGSPPGQPNRAPMCMFSRDALVAPNRYSSDRTLLRAKKFNPGRRRKKASNRQCSYLKDSPTCLALEPKYSVPGYRQSCRVLGVQLVVAVFYICTRTLRALMHIYNLCLADDEAQLPLQRAQASRTCLSTFSPWLLIFVERHCTFTQSQ